MNPLPSGLVIKAEANFYTVAVADQTYLCTVRANLKKAGQTIRVGDQVTLDSFQDERAVITALYTRRTELSKPAIANVDQALVVMSAREPDFNFLLIDRLLLVIRLHELQPILCINKCDLSDAQLSKSLLQIYQGSGYPLLFVSARGGIGIEALRQHLSGHISVLAGPSGVGKSSLLNAIKPGLTLPTRDVSERMGQGKHTTRHVSLHAIYHQQQQGWLADSPGFGYFDLPDMDPAELGFYYPEFVPFIPQCHYQDCLHREETDCAVKTQLDTQAQRYTNYLGILAEVEERFRQKQQTSSKAEKTLKTKAAGQNTQLQLLKLGTIGRASSRHSTNQDLAGVEKWVNFDPEWLEDQENT